MTLSILAHGGQLTGDEMAVIGGGLMFALLFPIAALVVATRRYRDKDAPDADESGNSAGPTAATAVPQTEVLLPPTSDPAVRI